MPVPVTDGRMQGVLGDIMARKRPDLLSVEQNRHLLISGSVIKLPERSTAVVGRRPSGTSRFDTTSHITSFRNLEKVS